MGNNAEYTDLIAPEANAREAAVIDSVSVRPVSHLYEVVEFLSGRCDLPPFKGDPVSFWERLQGGEAYFEDEKGQELAKTRVGGCRGWST